jgi:PIN domain nuclease of toxin-antitoxin system
MSAFVADTHAVIWYILDDKRLSKAARTSFDRAVESGDAVYVSAISLVEIHYLVEKGRLTATFIDRLESALADPDAVLVSIPVSFDIAHAVSRINRSEVPDMPDRIIAATAFHLDVPLITRDRKIRASSIESIW